MDISYSKMKSGEWGVRIKGSQHKPGDKVIVTKKDGSKQDEVLGNLVWSDATTQLFAKAKQNRPSSPKKNRESGCSACRRFCTGKSGGFCSYHHDGCDKCGAEGYCP